MRTTSKQSSSIDFRVVPSFWITGLALEKTERLATLQITSAKVALEKGVQGITALTNARQLEDLHEVRRELAESGVEYLRAYSKDLYQILSETQAEFSALLQRTWTSYAAGVEDWAEQSVETLPAAKFAAEVIKNGLAATNGTLQQVSEATQQAGILADETIQTAMKGSKRPRGNTKRRQSA